jgi:hypothetical protein
VLENAQNGKGLAIGSSWHGFPIGATFALARPFCWSLWMQQLRRVRVIKPALSRHVTGALGLDKLGA